MCIEANGNFTCDCTPQFTGQNCETFLGTIINYVRFTFSYTFCMRKMKNEMLPAAICNIPIAVIA